MTYVTLPQNLMRGVPLKPMMIRSYHTWIYHSVLRYMPRHELRLLYTVYGIQRSASNTLDKMLHS